MVVRGLPGRFSGQQLVTKGCLNGSLCLFWPLRGQKRHREPSKTPLGNQISARKSARKLPNHHFDPIWVPLHSPRKLTLPAAERHAIRAALATQARCISRVVGIPEETDIHQSSGQMPGILAR